MLDVEGFRILQGLGPYSNSIKKAEKEIKEMAKKINDLCGMQINPALSPVDYVFSQHIILMLIFSFQLLIGIKESDTGLAAPSQWDLVSDKQMMQEEQPLQVLLSKFWNLQSSIHPSVFILMRCITFM